METSTSHGNIMDRPKIATSVTQLVGKTPLLQINRIPGPECKAKILLKLESMEPFGSVKDRLAYSLITEAEKRGDIKPGKTTLIEGTSGNTGIALSFIAAARGYSTILVMPDTMSMERRVLLIASGAKVDEIAAELGDSGYKTNQFSSQDNPKIHFETTGPELWYQTDGEIDAFVAGIGTAGTMTGTTKYLKSMKPSLKSIAVEPLESAVLSGATRGPHKIMGIGAGVVPDLYDDTIVDEVIAVSSSDAMEMSRQIIRTEGLLVGISAGAAVHAAVTLGCRPEYDGKTICVIIPSNAERYLSTELFASTAAEAKALPIAEM